MAEGGEGVGGRILVVDDEAIERELLSGLLDPNGYKVRAAADGREALGLAAEFRPDCILLDLVMAGLGGIETCRSLKADPTTAIIPVIIITAEVDRRSRLEAIAAGADDFLNKPYDRDEVLLRVRNAVRMKRLYDHVESDLQRLRTLEATKDSFTHMLIHDLKQPLTAVKAYGDLVHLRLESGTADPSTLVTASGKIGELVESLEAMIALILDITRLEEGGLPLDLELHELEGIFTEAAELNRQPAEARGVTIDIEASKVATRCDRPLVVRIAENLLSNALKYSPEGGAVEVSFDSGEGWVGFSVSDRGPGIPPEYHSLIFEKFGQVEMGRDRKKFSSGLGLAFCKLACEVHGGSISVENRVDGGSIFHVHLPNVSFDAA